MLLGTWFFHLEQGSRPFAAFSVPVGRADAKHFLELRVVFQSFTDFPQRCFFNLLIDLWLHWVFVAVCRLFLVAVNRGSSLVLVLGLLITVASLVVEHRL